jgi:hypothetical protein
MLQFSQPPRDSQGPRDTLALGEIDEHQESGRQSVNDQAESVRSSLKATSMEQDDPYDDLMGGDPDMDSAHPDGRLIESQIDLDSDQKRMRKKLRTKMRKDFVKKTQKGDPYADKEREKQDFMKGIQRDLKKLAGDPKGINKMRKLNDQQLKHLKDEQMRQLYDEREVLKTQAEEVKRLEWLAKNVNHSYGL